MSTVFEASKKDAVEFFKSMYRFMDDEDLCATALMDVAERELKCLSDETFSRGVSKMMGDRDFLTEWSAIDAVTDEIIQKWYCLVNGYYVPRKMDLAEDEDQFFAFAHRISLLGVERIEEKRYADAIAAAREFLNLDSDCPEYRYSVMTKCHDERRLGAGLPVHNVV